MAAKMLIPNTRSLVYVASACTSSPFAQASHGHSQVCMARALRHSRKRTSQSAVVREPSNAFSPFQRQNGEKWPGRQMITYLLSLHSASFTVSEAESQTFMTYADLFAMLFASHLRTTGASPTYARCSSADAAVRGAVRERERERENGEP